MGTIYIDDKAVPFEPGENVLQAALKAGIEAPHFCYHEALGSAGACRMCAMEMAGKTPEDPPRVVMTCMQPAADGQHYKMQGEKSSAVQKGVVEYLMTRHPHDCPVCDEAGECHLQDMTILGGHRERRFDGKKMTYPNQELGPLLYNTANRCITCYRCVRFYQDYALGDDFGAYGSSNHVVFRRAEAGPCDSPFSGNIADVCPTGTFTDKVYRRKFSRTWQLEKAPSVCEHCSVGCGVEPGGREGSLRRIHPSPNPGVNPFFICDRGRYGAHYSESKERPLTIRSGAETLSEEALIAELDHLLQSEQRVGILASPHEDLGSLLALKHLAHRIKAPFSAFISPLQEQLTRSALQASFNPPTLTDIEQADLVLVLGDLTEAAPMMDLAVRQVIKGKQPVFMLHAQPSLLADLLSQRGYQTVSKLAPQSWAQQLQACIKKDGINDFTSAFISAMEQAQNIVCLGVADNMDCASIEALGQLVRGLEHKVGKAQLGFALAGANAAGAALVSPADGAQQLLQAVSNGEIDTLVCCGSDPFGLADGHRDWQRLRQQLNRLIVLDNVPTRTSQQADLLIPLASWPERNGYSINYEGRLQAFKAAYRRSGVYQPEQLLAQLSLFNPGELSTFRDSWLLNTVGLLPTQGGQGVRVALNLGYGQCTITTPSADTVPRLQIVRRRWHGDSGKARHAEALASLSPFSQAPLTAWVHPETAAQLGFAENSCIQLSEGDPTLLIMLEPKLAKQCLAITQDTMAACAVSIGQMMPVDAIQVLPQADMPNAGATS